MPAQPPPAAAPVGEPGARSADPGPAAPAPPGAWNTNIHYHRVILTALPPRRGVALDIGCGEGILVRELAARFDRVVGVDLDAASIALARATTPQTNATYVHGDALTLPLAPRSFDMVTMVATLHHMDAAEGLRRVKELLRPGGVLALTGLAAVGGPRDLAWDGLGALDLRRHLWFERKQHWEHSAPKVWTSPTTYARIRRIARRELPGVRYRRHPMWRYSLVWTKPA